MTVRINQSQTRIDRIRNRITHAQMRAECSFWIGRMFQPINESQRSVKALINKIEARTGLGCRRIEKLWRQYVEKPTAQEHATLRAAFNDWMAEMEQRGLSTLADNEGEHEESLRFATSRGPMGGDCDVVAGADAVPVVPRQNDGEGRP